jgi:hypothetical protein
MSDKKHIEEIRRELGKWVFVEKTIRDHTIMCELFSNALLGIAAAVVFFGDSSDAVLWAGLIASVALIFTTVSYSKQRSYVECREKGVMKVSGVGVRVVRFEDLYSFSFGVTNHFTNGIYRNTAVEIHLKEAGSGEHFLYSFETRSQDAGKYGIISELVAPFISKRMHDIVCEKGLVPWSGEVSLSSRGIHTVRWTGKIWKREKEEVLLPFSKDLRYRFAGGIFRVFNDDNDGLEIPILCSEENFHPGFHLMKRLYAEAEENGTLIGSKSPKMTDQPERKSDDRTTCPSCGFRRKWSLFKKYGAVKQTPRGSFLTCYSCHEPVFLFEGGV